MKPSKPTKSGAKRLPAASALEAAPEEQAFAEVVEMIQAARGQALAAVNTALIDLYWRVGEYISRRIDTEGWGEGYGRELAAYIQRRHPSVQGFSPGRISSGCANSSTPTADSNSLNTGETIAVDLEPAHLEQVEAARGTRVLPPNGHSTTLVGAGSCTPDRRLPVRTRGAESAKSLSSAETIAPRHRGGLSRHLPRRVPGTARWSSRGRSAREPAAKPAPFPGRAGPRLLLRRQRGAAPGRRKGLRSRSAVLPPGLNCLVAVELKIGEFQPEHLGKLEFYLEALDRDVRKPHEGPSIGVLLCASKDSEVVEYALSRSLSPALVAEYQTRLPDKRLLQAKLHEFYALTEMEAE